MAIPMRGYGATIGLGEESAWGTAVSRTNWLRAASLNPRRAITIEPDQHLGTYGSASTNHRFHHIASDNADVDFSLPLAYDDSSVLLLKHILGDIATTGAGPTYTHTATLASPGPEGLTIECIHGTHATLDEAEVYEGCRINTAEFSFEFGKPVMLNCSAIAQVSAGMAAAGTPTYSTGGNLVKHDHASLMTIGGGTFPFASATLRVNRNLQRINVLGSLNTYEPAEDRITVELDVTFPWYANTLISNYLASTQADIVITMTGTGSRTMTFTLHNCVPMDLTKQVGGAGPVNLSAKFKAFADGTDTGLSIVTVNGNSAATAN